MNFDCGFTIENNWFRYRTGALILNDGRLPFVKSKLRDYCYLIGGAVELGETSIDSIEREVYEELGVRAEVSRLAVVCENFFTGEGGNIDKLACHTLEFYYIMNVPEDSITSCRELTDGGEEIVWLTVDEIKRCVIKPEFIRERIDEIIEGRGILHIIEDRDRNRFV